jgi:hypothetical protein
VGSDLIERDKQHATFGSIICGLQFKIGAVAEELPACQGYELRRLEEWGKEGRIVFVPSSR